ncbi:bifunctional 2-C-methyl-D-erythritol 4-phosphate cytidylyltransferase/2-C-methyl-D-erythritol 2,4-cyclodiphosphate synthase [Sphingomonas vulcanisoli]|nr:bifunctional 2-C-methyl-D-erythritol 4-phosphate cytidylyltransferase/2-C-methyl-D-erythritol 2,4-cyclodiphosphate synthase [Sphingomonas vulcanisoli]
MSHRISALVVAAGSGSRIGGDIPKQYRIVAGKPVLAHAVDALLAHSAIDEIVVVIGDGQGALYAEAIGDRPLPAPVIGGALRRESVANGLAAITGDWVLVHDAARPFLPASVIDRLIKALETAAGAIPVLPVADTLALGGPTLGDVVPRETLVRVQTPQAFHTKLLRDAHAAWDASREASDDAQMVRHARYAVAMVEGSAMLEKITWAEDFGAAERRHAPALVSRTGMGFDVHAFTQGDHLWLGGVKVPHGKALAGHSDADVALHALVDALLGTIGDGDIGSHFPPSDERWRGAASHQFLTHARDLVTQAGGRIDHVDVTIICEAPKIGPHRPAIRARIAELLAISEAQVSVKATTTEKLGFTGRGEGIAAQAVATVRVPEVGL